MRMHKLFEIGIFNAHGVCIGSDRESNGLFRRQTFIYIDWEAIEIAEWRHGSYLTVRKCLLKFFFVSQTHLFRIRDGLYRTQIDSIWGRDNKTHQLSIDLYDHRFGNSFVRYVFALCDCQRAKCAWMLLFLKCYLLFTEIGFHFFFTAHGQISFWGVFVPPPIALG